MIKLNPMIMALALLSPAGALANTGLANPAATYCIAQGGLYGIQDGTDGQTGICQLPDGTKIDAWTYFRENNADHKSDSFTRLANPAATYCIEIGGSYRIEDTGQGQVGICTKPDGTSLDAWDLFRADHPE